jgi:preprotein translocase subunit SecD
MIESLNVRLGIVGAVLIATILWLVPNVTQVSENWWFSQKKLNYGLDIQGGLHLVMGVDIDNVVAETTRRNAETLQAEFKEKGLANAIARVGASNNEMLVEIPPPSDFKKGKEIIETNWGSMFQVTEEEGTTLTLRYYDAYLLDYKSRILSQAIETLRNRVDEFGVAEPSITAQGEDRILVQLPGIKDAEKAKTLINQTAKLDFWLVDNTMDAAQIAQMVTEAEEAGKYQLSLEFPYAKYIERLNKDLSGKLPVGAKVLFEKEPSAATMEVGKIPMVLLPTNVSGADIKDAFVDFDEYQAPQVALRFNPIGGKKFGDLTGANVGRQIAVVLDGRIKSAPNVQGKIPNGIGVITLGGGRDRQKMLEEAKMISMSLRAGALPANLEQLEERTVGPTLGADSIAHSKNAGFLGAALVLLFMLVYYKFFGLVANLALVMNISMIIAALTSLGATLTLPGIAGIVLTMGMAVDANVIIYERIKEELKKGSGLPLAIKEGFGRAFSAIVDANITTGATCVVLIYFGSGPVRGFAVTLLIGIATSMFTAIFVTRVLVDTMLVKFRMHKASI